MACAESVFKYLSLVAYIRTMNNKASFKYYQHYLCNNNYYEGVITTM